MTIFLSRIPQGELHLNGYNTFQEMKADKHNINNIGFYGEVAKVKEYMAARWVRSVQGRYRDYNRPETYTGGFSSAKESFQSALKIIRDPKFIIVFQK